MVPDEAIRAGAPWLSGRGAAPDVVISSRVRLARNIVGFPFPPRCSSAQRAELLSTCRRCVSEAPAPFAPARVAWADIHALPALERQLLLERHLISREHAAVRKEAGTGTGGAGTSAAAAPPSSTSMVRGLAFTLPDEALSIMVNEEDHLRIQVLRPGLQLAECWRQINEVDSALENGLDFAFHDRFGYLTTCPTNAGSGVRMSVMLHLPALRLCGEIDKVRRATKDMCLAVRGFYGEGSDHAGDLFQISNQTTMGKPEETILSDIESEVIPRVIEYEQAARAQLAQRRRRHLEDAVFRALGLLQSARLLAPEETISHLSLVRLGVLTGLVGGLDEQAVSQLFLLSQPAHLQRFVGRPLDQQQRREARADLVRERLARGGASA